jgi:bacterioferritin
MPQFVKDVEEIRQRAIRKIEDGAVTSTYGLDKEKVISILNEALATEIVCVLRYQHHYFMATGVHGKAAADEFKEHADEEREHADKIAERIQQLGGKPDFNPRTLMERSVSHYIEGETLADMIREDLIAERMVIDVYREMIKFFGDGDSTTRIMIEKIMRDEEEHASDLSDLLYVVNPSTGQTETQDPGTEIGRNDREARMDRNTESDAYHQERSDARQRAKGQAEETRQALANIGDQKGRDRQQPTNVSQAKGAQDSSRDLRDVQPAHAPGTVGRPMNRRGKGNVDVEEDDIAVGGQSGTSRSPKVVQKNRKNRAE